MCTYRREDIPFDMNWWSHAARLCANSCMTYTFPSLNKWQGLYCANIGDRCMRSIPLGVSQYRAISTISTTSSKNHWWAFRGLVLYERSFAHFPSVCRALPKSGTRSRTIFATLPSECKAGYNMPKTRVIHSLSSCDMSLRTHGHQMIGLTVAAAFFCRYKARSQWHL